MQFDGRVAQYLPDFRIADAAARDVTIRDLLVQRTGVDRNDFVWYGTDLSRDEIVRRVRYLPQLVPFRSAFTYNNLMYLTAGQAVASAAGMSWDQFVRRRIIDPLSMTSTDTKLGELAARRDVATPHAEQSGGVRVIPWRSGDNVGPAGSITSNVVDMAQWLRFQLNGGTYAGRTLISENLLDETHKPAVTVPLSEMGKRFAPGTNLMAYAMGWLVSDFHGELLLKHNGNIDGMSSYAVMLPARKFGIVILSNLDGTQVGVPIALRILDAELGRPAHDWSTELAALWDSLMESRTQIVAAANGQRIPGTHPTRELSAYTGTYADSAFGEIRIGEERGSLDFAFHTSHGPLEHWNYDTFIGRLTNPEVSTITLQFHLDPSGAVSEIYMADQSGTATFRRIRPANNATTATAGR
jgi:CubicO group peptidase (beta-lactamase class C family)